MIEFNDISLRYGDKVLFGAINVQIGQHDRIGLVGSNGAGKSTLLKLLMGQVESDRGEVEQAKYVTVGYLPQDGLEVRGKPLFEEVELAFEDIKTIQEKIDSASEQLNSMDTSSEQYHETLEIIGSLEHRLEELEVHRLRSKIERVLLGLGFSMSDMTRETGEFSGGWQMRIALAKLLLREPSLLLMDEPTNHLDLDSLRWLENYLQNYDGAILLVSHDRAFLDSLTTSTFSLSMGRLEVYSGNYTYFEKESASRKEHLEKAFKNQQREIEQTEKFIERFRAKATKARQVQSRIKALDKIERIELEDEENSIGFSFPAPPRSGQVVLELDTVSKAYGDNLVFKNISLKIERGERIAVVGVNGAGKSTLSRVLAGVEPFNEGDRKEGHNVALSYFAQHQAEELDPALDALTTLESVSGSGMRDRARNLLGSFLFRGDDVFKKVSVLSGGEKNRLALAKMLLEPCNFLILDEPTNHLDMNSKAVLQNALREYSGAYLIVSHDRYFLDPLVEKVLEISKTGVRVFLGNVSDYILKVEAEKAAAQQAQAAQLVTKGETKTGDVKNPKERRQQIAARNRVLAPLKKKSTQLEESIQSLETQLTRYETEMVDPEFFKRGEQTKQAMAEYESIKRKIERAYEKWDQVQEEMNQYEAGDE